MLEEVLTLQYLLHVTSIFSVVEALFPLFLIPLLYLLDKFFSQKNRYFAFWRHFVCQKYETNSGLSVCNNIYHPTRFMYRLIKKLDKYLIDDEMKICI